MNENGATEKLRDALHDGFSAVDDALSQKRDRPAVRRVGTVAFAGGGVARVEGLAGVRYGEVLEFPEGVQGLAFDVDEDGVGAVLLDPSDNLRAGDEVRRTDRVLDVPVGDALVGRVVDPMARPMDGRGPISTRERRPIDRPAPEIMDRAPVAVPLQTGLKVVDALIPVGRGQRELILGDRQTGKTAVALDTFLNQRDTDVLCIYCGVGKRSAAMARVIATLRDHGAMDSAIVMVTTEEDPPGRQYAAAYAATSMAEHFMEQGRDVLIVYDDLTRHARAYRELSLLLRRPPGREAFPGDIFYIHSRLLERSTHLREELGGGSLTALPVVETEAQNLSAYIPTNLISITDGQIYLSPDLFRKGQLPAVDVGESVSRVGGNAQLPAYRRVAGDLRLAFSQFEELEAFARFGTRLDEETRQILRRGRRVREVLKQPQYQPRAAAEQVVVLLAVNEGLFDELPPEKVAEATAAIRETVLPDHPDVAERIAGGEKLSDEDAEALVEAARKVIEEKFKADDSNEES